MVFFDDVGPAGADIVVGGYHWPKGLQGMDLHTGKWFWACNPDGDGKSNSEEFQALTNPRDASDYFRILAASRVGNSFSVSIQIMPGRRYTLQKCATLGDIWGDVRTAGPPAGVQTISMTDDNAPLSTGFYRVKVSTP